jgi:hypothetical protein
MIRAKIAGEIEDKEVDSDNPTDSVRESERDEDR